MATKALDRAAKKTSDETLRLMRRRKFLDVALDYGLYGTLLALVIFFSLTSPYFLTPRNLTNIAVAVSVTGILAAGFTVALIAGQVDISIGATLGLTAVVMGVLTERIGLPWLVAALLALLVGLVVGLINSFLVVGFAINSLIATLAISVVLRGGALILAGGQVIPLTDTGLQEAVNSRPLGIPVPVILLLGVFAIGWLVLTHAKVGWHVYAVGANPNASLRSGISTKKIFFGVFVTSGILASVGGLISAGQAGGGGPTFGDGIEFQVLAAVLLAGFGLQGGTGRFERALIGVVLVGVLLNGLILLGVDAYYQYLARGVVFVLAVVLASLATRKASR